MTGETPPWVAETAPSHDAAVGEDALLSGNDPTPGIVAVEPAGREAMRVYRRPTPAAAVEITLEPFRPWLIVDRAPHWPALAHVSTVTPLAGEARYRFLVCFAHWPAWLAARELLAAAGQEWLGFRAPVEQFLAATGKTLFKGLAFDDLVRLQLDIETTGLDPAAPDARILLVVIGSNRGHEEAIGAAGEDERAILARLTAQLRVLDPDVIEGHHLFNFDLPYLLARAAAHRVSLAWGRDGSAVTAGSSQRYKVGARAIPFAPHRISGRHVLDTYQQMQRYDVGGVLTSYGLKESIAALGLTRAGRTFIAGEDLRAAWDRDRAAVVRYALDDLRDVAALSALTAPTEFYQAQLLPRSFQQVATGGSGEKVNALLLRAYLAAGAALPGPEPASGQPGGYSAVRAVGVFGPVVKCDVESLYPALLLADGVGPAGDRLGVFLPLLHALTARRLAAKARARASAGAERAYWQGLQASLKVLINSFYGYLGYGRAVLNDSALAGRLTQRGQALIKGVVAELEHTGARPIEIDTDGVYFVPPPDVVGQAAEESYVAAIGRTLPPGLHLAFDGRYRAMLSLKAKNYVLQEEAGGLVVKGSSLRSRRDERFLRRFLEDAAARFLDGTPEAVRDCYLATARRLQQRELAPTEFCRWETIPDRPAGGEGTRRLARLARGHRSGERLQVYQRRDGTLALLAEYAQDEDTTYLLRRLRDGAARFADLYPDAAAFAYAFPTLHAASDLDAARARTPVSQLSLF